MHNIQKHTPGCRKSKGDLLSRPTLRAHFPKSPKPRMLMKKVASRPLNNVRPTAAFLPPRPELLEALKNLHHVFTMSDLAFSAANVLARKSSLRRRHFHKSPGFVPA